MSKYSNKLFLQRATRLESKLREELSYVLTDFPQLNIEASCSLKSTYFEDDALYSIEISSKSQSGFSGTILKDVFHIVGNYVVYVDNAAILIEIF